MNKIRIFTLPVLCFLACASRAEEVVIQALGLNGTLSFNEVQNAFGYRVEWSPSAESGWTNFTGDYGRWMDNIPATGSGVITARVPMFYRVVATVPPEGMVYVPAGTFMMGNATNILPVEEGGVEELPQHEVNLDAFYIDKYEVSNLLWLNIEAPAKQYLGYAFSLHSKYPSTLPMADVPWYDAVKWCNARSEVEGLRPVYYTDAAFSNIYKAGVSEPYADWSANGYRLPTEAEWEKAARGGQPGLRFPWSDYTNKISHAKANYWAEGTGGYDESFGPHPDFSLGDTPRRSPIGYFMPNDYGLYDMAGNIWEWCWDWYYADYYSSSPSANPRGPDSGTERVLRGGSLSRNADWARASARASFYPIFETLEIYVEMGFRCVRRP